MMFPDSGRSYLTKFYDDNWMLQYGFLEREGPPPMVAQVLAFKQRGENDAPDLLVVGTQEKVAAAIGMMQEHGISQLLVARNGGNVDTLADIVGSLNERDLLDVVFKNPDALHQNVVNAMAPPLGAVDIGESLDGVFATLTGRSSAVVAARNGRPEGVLTRSDLLEYLAHARSQAS